MSAPDRIYNWLDSQLSVARFYGGLIYKGERYVIDQKTKGAPLVKSSVLVEKSKLARQLEKKKKEVPTEKQESLL
jgi:CxxC motif-containing protein